MKVIGASTCKANGRLEAKKIKPLQTMGGNQIERNLLFSFAAARKNKNVSLIANIKAGRNLLVSFTACYYLSWDT